MARMKGMLFGALAGSLAASILAFLEPKEVRRINSQTQDWAEKARNLRENLLDDFQNLTVSRKNRQRNTFLRGALLGLFVGACSAALLTPKSGKQMRKDLGHQYKGLADKTHDIIETIDLNGYYKPLKKLSRSLRSKSKARTRTR